MHSIHKTVILEQVRGMTSKHLQVLRELGFQPECCISIGHDELGRHGVYQCGEQIIKLYGNGVPSAAARARAEQLYTERARENGVCTPRVLRAGTALSISYTISQRLEGVVACAPPSDALAYEMGIMLGKLHRPFLSDGTAWHNAWLQELRQAAQRVRATAAGIEALSLCDRTLAYIESISPHLFSLLPMGTMHGDFSTRNVLCMDDHVCAIIDFELAHDGNVELELARFYQKELCGSSARIAAFQTGYAENAFLAPGFGSRLPLYILGDALIGCSWSKNTVNEFFDECCAILRRFLMRREHGANGC